MNDPTDTHNTWWDSAALYAEPTFNGVCPSASSYAMWPGIADDTHLIQAGTDVDPAGNGPNDDVAWYELIGPDEKNSAVNISPSDLAINAGDHVWIDVTYDNSADEVDFDIGNITTGKEYFVDVSSYDGHDAHFYYSGDRTEYVAERATQSSLSGDKILQLANRKATRATGSRRLATEKYSVTTRRSGTNST